VPWQGTPDAAPGIAAPGIAVRLFRGQQQRQRVAAAQSTGITKPSPQTPRRPNPNKIENSAHCHAAWVAQRSAPVDLVRLHSAAHQPYNDMLLNF